MMKDWLYYLANVWLYIPMRICFRKIYFSNRKNYKKDVPVFLACNHPNSFLDGVIFENCYWRNIYTLARGDAFKKPAVNYIFRRLRLLPIFRASDATADEARSGNSRTKDELYTHFAQNDTILIFSEGIAYPEKAVRRVKKGTAQIALEIVEKSDYKLDLYVVPTALNYSRFDTLMQTVHVSYGEPIRILDYADRMKTDLRACVEEITTTIDEYLHQNVVITKGDYTEEKELLQTMMINESYVPFFFILRDRWKGNISKLNNASHELLAEAKEYSKALKKSALYDENVGQRSVDIVSFVVAILTAYFSLPVFFVLVLGFWGVNILVKKKVSNVVFKDSFRVGVTMLFSILLVIGILVVLGREYDGFMWIGVSFLAAYGAICWARVVESAPYLAKNVKWWSMPREERVRLKELRASIWSKLS